MENKQKLTFIAILMLFALIVSGLSLNFRQKNVTAQNQYSDSPYPNVKMGFKQIVNVLSTLKGSYIEDVKPVALINSSIDALKKFCKEKKLQAAMLKNIDKSADPEDAINNFKSQFNSLLDKYEFKFESNELVYVALKGMMDALRKAPYKDPYTDALTPKEYKYLDEQINGGNFHGIGIYIELDKKHNNQLTVLEPIEETPAYRGGLKPGDWIMKIDGASTKGIDLEVAANKIRGTLGSKVVLTIKRKNQPEKDYSFIRDLIHVKSASAKILEKDIGYIKLKMFGEETNKEFGDALDKLEAYHVKALIIDIRNNGGGYIDAAVSVCSNFIPRGQLVVSVVSRAEGASENKYSYGVFHRRVPVIVLINKYSASASEITAGALKDSGAAVLMGEKSFGKGSVQQVSRLPDGGALKYTIAHYLTPGGRNISKNGGIEPDIKVAMDPQYVGDKKKDVQLRKAIQYLKSKIKS
ncbi:MAG: S41 family peptidase [Firmicutes bacterium]|nr:S41 family peptidase [Bacillota bacterium]